MLRFAHAAACQTLHKGYSVALSRPTNHVHLELENSSAAAASSTYMATQRVMSKHDARISNVSLIDVICSVSSLRDLHTLRQGLLAPDNAHGAYLY